jgi:hypothetical protein
MFPKMGPLCNSEQRRNFNLENWEFHSADE